MYCRTCPPLLLSCLIYSTPLHWPLCGSLKTPGSSLTWAICIYYSLCSLLEISTAGSLASVMFKCKFLSGSILTTPLEISTFSNIAIPIPCFIFFIILIAMSHKIFHSYFTYCHPQLGCKLHRGIGFHLLCSLAYGRHSINKCRGGNEVCTLGIQRCSQVIFSFPARNKWDI